MGVKLLGYLSLSWWTVILYYYTFSIIESISKAYTLFSLLYHNPYHNLCSYWHHVSILKNTIMYSELDKQYLLSVIICLHLLLYMLYSRILFLYHVYWHLQTERKEKLICYLRVSYRRPCKYTYTALSIDWKIVSVSPTNCLNSIHDNFGCSIVILCWRYSELSDTHKRGSCKLISANSTYHCH